jgi:hypothetical protein
MLMASLPTVDYMPPIESFETLPNSKRDFSPGKHASQARLREDAAGCWRGTHAGSP